jgi:hypothetical protein
MTRWILPTLVLLVLASCGKNQAPSLSPVGDHTAYVGSRLEIRLVGSDPDYDPLTYSFSCPTLDIDSRAHAGTRGGDGYFDWTPIAADVGEQQVDFTVSDGSLSDSQSAIVTVKASTSPDTAPIFRKPLGEGSTLNVSLQACLSLDVLVEDADSLQVDLTQQTPIAGSSMQPTGPYSAVFSWCPRPEQVAQQLFVLRFLANDHDNAPVCPKVCKDYTVLVLSDLPRKCPGEPPKIVHAVPGPQTTADPIAINATVTDDKKLKAPPTVYYTTTKPANPAKLDLGALGQATMVQTPAGSTGYRAMVPNPTSSLTAGSSRTLYYVIVAEDDDDPVGSCDHRTQAPPNDMFQVVITRPQGAKTCVKTGECGAGLVCNGTCVPNGCTAADTNNDGFYWDQNGCPPQHVCVARGSTGGVDHCVETGCLADADCKQPGYRCKVVDTEAACGLAGNGIVGDPCGDFTACSDKLMCLQWKSGYCSLSDCDSYGGFSGPCPAGSVCVPLEDTRFSIGEHWLCLKSCSSNAGCRTTQGYACKSVTDDTGATVKACLVP